MCPSDIQFQMNWAPSFGIPVVQNYVLCLPLKEIVFVS